MSGAIVRYHDRTKHGFDRLARSMGYLDWANQPHPFRYYRGADALELAGYPPAEPAPYEQLYRVAPLDGQPVEAGTIANFFRYALGVSAWKRAGNSRWALRVNPSSGNLHPTEGYAVLGPVEGWSNRPAVYHYVPETHTLEQRCVFPGEAWDEHVSGVPAGCFLVGLSSIHWREAWKYGERAFRYCQHDTGHAIAALRFSAALLGWGLRLLPGWSHRGAARLLGLDREGDFLEAEHEEPECLALVGPGVSPVGLAVESARLGESVASGRWRGQANRLSEQHVDWDAIDDIARATRSPGLGGFEGPAAPLPPGHPKQVASHPFLSPSAQDVILGRRSGVDFDPRSVLPWAAFERILDRLGPGSGPPWDALWWQPAVAALALFVHRVEELAPGLYLLVRRLDLVDVLKAHTTPEFEWVVPRPSLPLFRLAQGNVRKLARRLSCDQDIAAHGFFSLGMIAEFEASLARYGEWFYRHLFWEAGVIGQVIYLEAEAAGARGTGIGCYYDDPVHRTLGLEGHGFQSLYHFTVGIPVEDERLTTEAGYPWEHKALA